MKIFSQSETGATAYLAESGRIVLYFDSNHKPVGVAYGRKNLQTDLEAGGYSPVGEAVSSTNFADAIDNLRDEALDYLEDVEGVLLEDNP